MAHGMGHGAIGVLVSAWPALALVGAYELFMILIRAVHVASSEPAGTEVEPTIEPAGRAPAGTSGCTSTGAIGTGPARERYQPTSHS